MKDDGLEDMLREACNSTMMCKMNAVVRELTGVGLLVVWSCHDQWRQIPICGNGEDLPLFCRLIHEAPHGLARCVTCHSLLALAARHRGGATQGVCHGGANVVAAPALPHAVTSLSDLVVMSSCACMLPDLTEGWRMTRQVSRDLGIERKDLRRAYGELPDLKEGRMKLMTELVDVAASALSEYLRARLPRPLQPNGMQTVEDIGTQLSAALHASRAEPYRRTTGSPQRTVVDVVLAVVGANPQLPVSVADIAAAAHMTPNHFSLVFHRQTGKTFTEFVSETRFRRAEECLRDPTLSIKDVARQSGFADPNYFAKVFCKRTGVSPTQWRKTNRTSRRASRRTRA